MKLANILRGTKRVLDTGTWQKGHIPRSAFPLSTAKAKNYKFGLEYQWRVLRFECVAEFCRLLVIYNEGKQIFRAVLGIEDGNDMRVLCHYEYHASEPGWHCHLRAEDHAHIPKGVNRTNMRRWPAAGVPHKYMMFGVERRSALSKAADRFRINVQGDLL